MEKVKDRSCFTCGYFKICKYREAFNKVWDSLALSVTIFQCESDRKFNAFWNLIGYLCSEYKEV